MLYPIYPGIWVGIQVGEHFGGSMMLAYAAGIGTMTLLGGALGSVFEWLGNGRRAAAG